MSIISVLLLIIVLLLWTWVIWSRRKFYWVYTKLPGPLGLPFIGIALQMMNPKTFLHNLNQFAKVYKTPFITWLGSECVLYVNDPVTTETVLRSPACTNKGDMYHFLAAAIGDGLFTSSAPRWNKHRRLLEPAFNPRTIQSFLPLFNSKLNEFAQKLTLSHGQSLDIYDAFKKTVLEIACQTTMGKTTNFQKDESLEIFNFFNGLLDSVIKRMLSPWLYPNLIFHNSDLFKSQQKAVVNFHNFMEKILKKDNGITMKNESTKAIINTSEDAYENVQQKQGYNKFRANSFLECVRQHIREGLLTSEDVRDEANVIMAGSFETTAMTLYIVCLCLALHPKEQDKLHNELIELFPVNCKVSNVDDITLEHLELMTYTEMVINEAMRLFAPVPVVVRKASSDFNLADGTQVPQGTQIAIDIFNMQRSEDIWGSHARSFDPERHFGTSNEQHSYAFIPFTKGRRSCIGSRYSMMLMKVLVAKIFRNFRVHTVGQMSDLKVRTSMVLKLCEYPLCSFEQRALS